MLVYLGELQHTAMTIRPGHFVPLAIGFLSSYLKKHSPEIEVKLFTSAEALLDAVDEKQPDVVGLSVRFWSEKLSLFCAQSIKDKYPDTVLVAGGPSIDDIDSEIVCFLQNNSDFDVCVPNEGEIGLLSLIESLQETEGWDPDKTINGCCNLGQDGALRRGPYLTADLAETPSPYLDGTMDYFLEEGFDILFETTRGCPYRCKFCVDGSALSSKVRRLSMERVEAEFDYIKKRATGEFMFITDLNFGILGKRDVAIARMVKDSNNGGGFPKAFNAYAFKRLNEENREIAYMFKDQAERTIAFQSMDPDVVEEVGRYNLKIEDFDDDLVWAKEKGVRLNVDFIFGFAGEKVDSFIESIEQLIRKGANRIQLYNLKLISGSDLAMAENREQYKFKSKFRRFGRNYGVYRGQPIVETEEIVTGADTFDFDDFMEARLYGMFLNLSLMLGYLIELVDILIRVGLPGEKLIRFLSKKAPSHGEHLSTLIAEYQDRTNSELFDTHEGAVEGEISKLEQSGTLPESRLDWIYVGKMIFNEDLRLELFDLIRLFVREQGADETTMSLIDDYLSNVLAKQIIDFTKDEPGVVHITSCIDLDKLSDVGEVPAQAFLKDTSKEYELHLPEPAAEFISTNYATSGFDLNEAAIQDIFVKLGATYNNCLLRNRSEAHPQ